MPTPALSFFLSNVGQTVHHLNTAVVALSGLEHGDVRKPDDLDITWKPADVVTSARKSRLFLVKSSLVFVATALTEYVDTVVSYPCLTRPSNWSELSNAEKLVSLNRLTGSSEDYLVLGPSLLIHWRNRIVHPKSNAALSSRQRDILLKASPEIKANYKNLDPAKLITDFESETFTLKGASSLVAMSINLARRIDKFFFPPATVDDLKEWIETFGFSSELEAVEKSAQGEHGLKKGEMYLRTNCSFLANSYAALKRTG